MYSHTSKASFCIAFAAAFGLACSDGSRIIISGTPEAHDPVDPGPQEMQPDDPIFPQPVPDAGPAPTPPDEPTPEPTPPPPAWEAPLYLIPSDQDMADMFRNNRIEEFFWETFGVHVQLLPIGTSKYDGIPLYWNANPDIKYIGMATLRRGCFWTTCHGNAHIWLHAAYKDLTHPNGLNGKWGGVRVTAIHEIGHVITGLGSRSKLDTLASGHLEKENLMDPNGHAYFSPLDGEYFCHHAAPCQRRNKQWVYVGHEPWFNRWPQRPDGTAGLDAGLPDAGPLRNYYDDGPPYFDLSSPDASAPESFWKK